MQHKKTQHKKKTKKRKKGARNASQFRVFRFSGNAGWHTASTGHMGQAALPAPCPPPSPFMYICGGKLSPPLRPLYKNKKIAVFQHKASKCNRIFSWRYIPLPNRQVGNYIYHIYIQCTLYFFFLLVSLHFCSYFVVLL